MQLLSEHIRDHLKEIRNSVFSNGRFSQEGLENILVQYIDNLEKQKQNFQDYREIVIQAPVGKALIETVEGIRQKKLGISKRERDIFARLGLMVNGSLEQAVIDGNIAYFNSVKEVTQINEFLAWDAIEGYAAEVQSIDISKDTPEKCVSFAGTERHNRLFASTVGSVDKMILKMIAGFRSALNEQTEYYRFRGQYMQNIEGLVNDPKMQVKYCADRIDIAVENSSEIIGFSLPGRAEGIEKNLSILSEPYTTELDNETFARFIEYFAKKMSNYVSWHYEDASRKHAPAEQMTMDEKRDFYKINASIIMKEMAETNAFNFALGSDYLSRKAYNMRVLTRFGSDVAGKYRIANPLDPQKLSLGLKEFTDYIKDIDSRDEQLFRKYLLGLPNGNGNSNGHINGNNNGDSNVSGNKRNGNEEQRNIFYQTFNQARNYVGNILGKVLKTSIGGQEK
jgi:hypothetical protein